MHTCISSHGLKRSWRSCARRVNAGNKHTPSTHHPRRRNVTTLMVGLKNGHIRKNLTQKWWTPEIWLGNAKKKNICEFGYSDSWNCYGPWGSLRTLWLLATTFAAEKKHGLPEAYEHLSIWPGVALTFEKLRIANAQHGKNCVSSPAAKATISTTYLK